MSDDTEQSLLETINEVVDKINNDDQRKINTKALLLHQALNADYFEGKNQFIKLAKRADKDVFYIKHRELNAVKNVQNSHVSAAEGQGGNELEVVTEKKLNDDNAKPVVLTHDEVKRLDDVQNVLESAESIKDLIKWFKSNIETFYWMDSLKNQEDTIRYSNLRSKESRKQNEVKWTMFDLVLYAGGARPTNKLIK